jgi:hypothetical protein
MGVFHNWGDYSMRNFNKFYEEMTSVGSVAGLTGEPPVHLKKKKKKPDVVKRFMANRKEHKGVTHRK